jgi:hypothetical protein
MTDITVEQVPPQEPVSGMEHGTVFMYGAELWVKTKPFDTRIGRCNCVRLGDGWVTYFWHERATQMDIVARPKGSK